MMKYGWGIIAEKNTGHYREGPATYFIEAANKHKEKIEMYTKKEYLESLENEDVTSILKKIDEQLRLGKRFIYLGYLDKDRFPYTKKKIVSVLEQAGWKCECAISSERDSDGRAYVKII